MLGPLKDNTGSVASVWDQQASAYDALRERDEVYSSCIYQSALAIPMGTAMCLDAGSGTGLSSIAIGTKCKTVVAVDYSFKSLEILKSRGFHNLIAVQADLTSLPFHSKKLSSTLLFLPILCSILRRMVLRSVQSLKLSELRKETE